MYIYLPMWLSNEHKYFERPPYLGSKKLTLRQYFRKNSDLSKTYLLATHKSYSCQFAKVSANE